MNQKLTIYKLGQILRGLEENYDIELFTKVELSGGWLTLSGKATIEEVPGTLTLGCGTKGNNIISIRVVTDEEGGASIKLIGAKDKKFNMNIAPTKYMEFGRGAKNCNEIQENNEECKLRIDEDVILKVKGSYSKVMDLIEKI